MFLLFLYSLLLLFICLVSFFSFSILFVVCLLFVIIVYVFTYGCAYIYLYWCFAAVDAVDAAATKTCVVNQLCMYLFGISCFASIYRWFHFDFYSHSLLPIGMYQCMRTKYDSKTIKYPFIFWRNTIKKEKKKRTENDIAHTYTQITGIRCLSSWLSSNCLWF